MAKVSAPAAKIAEYLKKQGVKFDAADLVAPDIASIVVAGPNPTQFVDRDGHPVPDELELYMVDASGGAEAAQQTIDAKVQDGFRTLPAGHGFHWQGRPLRQNEVVLMRTPERRAAFEEAAKRERARRRQQQSRVNVPGSDESILTETTVEEIQGKRPAL